MAHFLLLHGSWHGAWCWHKVIPRLEEAGHRVTAPDLPGRGRAPMAPLWVGLRTMVRAAHAALPAGERAVVVAHSRSGIVASALAEYAPERVAQSIYLAAFLLPSGKRVLDYLPDREAAISGHIRVNRLSLSDSLSPALYREGLYADCSAEDLALARSLLVPEPLRPALTRVRLSEARYGRVPRAYLRLSADRAVSPALQDRFLRETPVARVEELAASHSAYFSQPERLARAILALAAR